MAKIVFETSVLEKKDYEKSNKLEAVAKGKGCMPKPLYRALLEKSTESAESRRKYAQEFIEKLSAVYGISAPIVHISNSGRPASVKNGRPAERYGFYTPALQSITIYNQTAKKHNVVAIKTFTQTLLHEFMHHYDMVYLKLTYSRHTAGFYKRISDLEHRLSETTESKA